MAQVLLTQQRSWPVSWHVGALVLLQEYMEQIDVLPEVTHESSFCKETRLLTELHNYTKSMLAPRKAMPVLLLPGQSYCGG